MATYIGSNRAETIYGSDFRDVIRANGGNDDVFGYGGADDLYGGSGNDELHGGSDSDYLWGGSGINDLWGGSGFDRFILADRDSGYSDDAIWDFRSFDDQIDVRGWGISSFDQIKAIVHNDGNGNSVLDGSYNGYGHFLTIFGTGGGQLTSRDFVFSSGGVRNDVGTLFGDTMFGSRKSDTLNGANGDDTVVGGRGNDTLKGSDGDDKLFGGSGYDRLEGGRGRDVQQGGNGADTFVFSSVEDSHGNDRDVITDFVRDYDQFDVSGIDADSTVDGNQAFTWIGNAFFTGVGQLTFQRQGSDLIIMGNTDNDSTSEFDFRIADAFRITGNDFIL